MCNAYLRLWPLGSFVPATEMDDVTFSTSANAQSGDTNWSLAWSVMAPGWQMSERVTLDLGYRFLDKGKARSGTPIRRDL